MINKIDIMAIDARGQRNSFSNTKKIIRFLYKILFM